MGDPLSITVGHQAIERVSLEVVRRERPDDDDYWDGNWLVVDVQISAGGFSGHAVASLRADELRDFWEALERMHNAVTGTARLESMEGWLTLVFSCHKTGRITVEGEAADRPGTGNSLNFTLPDMDQTYLPGLIDELRDCERAYPVVGRAPQS